MIKLYELAGNNNVIFSPYCWRVRLALLHKELDFLSVETAFTEIRKISDGKFKTVPIIHDGDIAINDSFKVIEYLEANYPQQPPLFNSHEGYVFPLLLKHGQTHYMPILQKWQLQIYTVIYKTKIKLILEKHVKVFLARN